MNPRGPRKDSRSRRHLQSVPSPENPPAPDELLGPMASALDDPEPLVFLSLASTLVSAVDPRTTGILDDDGADVGLFVESLIAHPVRETTALLYALAELLPDNHLAQRARRESRRRDHPVPHWLSHLGDTEPGAAASTTDLFGDGENVIVSVRLAGGRPLSGIVYVDHNLGTVAKDGFVLPEDADQFRETFLGLGEDLEMLSHTELDPTEARARIVQAIEAGDQLFPPLESEVWPACRPLIEWMIGLLPAGGAGYPTDEVTPAEMSRITRGLLRSPQASALTEPEDAAIVGDLLGFAEYTGGDPLRWSPANVEILMTHWYPQAITAEDRYLRRMPAVLRTVVRYAHQQRGLPAHLTEQTLQAVDQWEPEYLDLLESGGPLDPQQALREVLAGLGSYRSEHAAAAVGGEDALAALDDAPLPDEPLSWEGVPDDIRPRVAAIARLCDACAEELFDVEMRTAFRRVLARTAATEPAVFRRRSQDRTAAAAIAWAVAAANDRLDPHGGGLTAKSLLAHFDVTGSVSTRARPFLRAFGADGDQSAPGLTFGTPDVLTGARRAELMRIRDDAD